jgi:hypothetical protein
MQLNVTVKPQNGVAVWLKNFGHAKLFRTQLKDQLRHYISPLSSDEQTASFYKIAFTEQHDRHWQIEQYHREIKPVCTVLMIIWSSLLHSMSWMLE